MINVNQIAPEVKAEDLQAKSEAFQIEELESRLEMSAWVDTVNVICGSDSSAQA